MRAAVIFVIFLTLAIQLYRPPRTNPPVDSGRTLYSRVSVPRDVQRVLDRACRDCHSSETRWPWYSHVAPLMWGVTWDVEEGRRHWNLSDWSFTTEESADVLDEICTEAERRTMPLPRYLWLHPDARLTDQEIERLCDWTNEAVGDLF